MHSSPTRRPRSPRSSIAKARAPHSALLSALARDEMGTHAAPMIDPTRHPDPDACHAAEAWGGPFDGRRIAAMEAPAVLFVVHTPGGAGGDYELAEGLEHLRELGLARPDLYHADGYLLAREVVGRYTRTRTTDQPWRGRYRYVCLSNLGGDQALAFLDGWT